MTNNLENLLLEHLRAIRSEQSAMRDDIREIKSRLISLERSMAGNYADIVDQHVKYDRITERLERIERRLELS